jgi:HK97 family phage major capsid protein
LITPTYENVVDLMHSVNDAYRADGNAAWLTNDRTAA